MITSTAQSVPNSGRNLSRRARPIHTAFGPGSVGSPPPRFWGTEIMSPKSGIRLDSSIARCTRPSAEINPIDAIGLRALERDPVSMVGTERTLIRTDGVAVFPLDDYRREIQSRTPWAKWL